MRDPRFRRELFIRCGITTIMSAIAFFILHITAWVWLFPVAVGALVVAKWAFGSEAKPGEEPAPPPPTKAEPK